MTLYDSYMLNESNPVDLSMSWFCMNVKTHYYLYGADIYADCQPVKCLKTEQGFTVSCPLVTLVQCVCRLGLGETVNGLA